ncbi:MAG: TonB-dependent hemoglobin/transferrin/lactoferrin family receptor, partial [Acinetobacter sp.]|nr:TonB-dependent hemoglobin/transferrin/lactoferrin family receptor [Acinetobacter sp.]
NCEFLQNPLGLKYNAQNQLVDANGQAVSYQRIPVGTITESLGTETYIMATAAELAAQNGVWTTRRSVIGRKIEDKRSEIRNSLTVPTGYSAEVSNPRTTNGCSINANGDLSCDFITGQSYYNDTEVNTLTVGTTVYDLTDPANSNIENAITRNALYDAKMLSCDAVNCDLPTLQAFKNGQIVNIPITVVERDGKKYAQIQDTTASSQTDTATLITPNNKGYIDNTYSQRDLITKTHQVNLDLNKALSIGSTQHDIAYGAAWSNTKKEMVNIAGNNALDVQWWTLYPTSCTGTDRYKGICGSENTYSFLIPVEAHNNAFYFADDIRVNDYVGLNVAYRYDRTKYKPEYINGVTPRIPSEIVNNLYVVDSTIEQKYDDVNNAKREANALANIAVIAQPKKYSASSYALGATFDPLSWLNIQAKYSSGFRIPTGDEIYFTFQHPQFSIRPNKELKAEQAKTQEIAVTVHGTYGSITGGLFKTDYRDFIDLAYVGKTNFRVGLQDLGAETYQNINQATALVKGLEMNAQLNVGAIWQPLDGMKATFKLTEQRGKVNGSQPMNAIQPRTAVFGLGYDHPSERFGANVYVTHVAKKKAQDSYNMFWRDDGSSNSYARWLSGEYTLVDLTTYVKPIKNLTLQAGVYNLTNRKYMTWDSARSIKAFGTVNRVDNDTGLGLNRFLAPERNFKLSAEFKF